MSTPRRIELQAGGISVPGLEVGDAGDSCAILFVHGNPGSSSDWSSLLAGVGEFARGVALDMPGFGKAPVPAGFDYEVDSYAQFLQEAVDRLGLERIHLVLHDFGGPFGLRWGIDHEQVWKSVVLINIGVLPDFRWHVMARRWRTPLLGELMQAWISPLGLAPGDGRRQPQGAAN
jgi:pimeloyl-ACP methyl ester carboxylesterase